MQLDKFAMAYVECALWSSTDNADDSGEEPLDANYTLDDIAPDTLATMAAECADFRDYVSNLPHNPAWAFDLVSLLDSNPEQAGHDFWLTRNRHGAGFWDGDWPEPAGRILTDAAHTFGSADLYVGDDGCIYQQ